jgi:hypothetical protein
MALPPELRDMVYKHLLIPSTKKIRRPKAKNEHHQLQGLSVLRVNHQIFHEASRVLYLKGHFRLYPKCISFIRHEPDYLAVGMACHMILNTGVQKYHQSYARSNRSALSSILNEATNAYETEYLAGNRQNKHLHVSLDAFDYDSSWAWVRRIFDPSYALQLHRNNYTDKTEKLQRTAWLQAQLRALFDDMRADLKIRAPNVTLTSDADDKGKPLSIITRRVNHREVRFIDTNIGGQKGKLVMRNKSPSVPVFEPFGPGEGL